MVVFKQNKNEIYVAMARAGFNQKYLAEKSCLDPSTVSLILNHKRAASSKSAIKIANALNTDVAVLFIAEY